MLLLAFLLPTTAAKEGPRVGVLAASVGDEVVLADPTSGKTRSFSTGPVAWLFPAPGGILFAPDLVNGKTTVIDLRTLSLREPIPGVTMPRFGPLPDRYLVLSKQLLVMSYPSRALMNRFEIPFENPWQVEVLAENQVLFVLERLPQGGGEVTLTAVNLGEGRVVYRRPLGGDVRHFAVSPELGLMALAAREAGQVILAEPATLTPVATYLSGGKPVDLVFVDDGSTLAVAIERSDGGGEIVIWKIKSTKKKGIERKKEWIIQMTESPVRVAASPDGLHVAAALNNGRLKIFEVESQALVAAADLGGAPRDVVWCDPSIEGPLLPDWSDDDAPTLDLSGG
jgi:hypothetical protein